MSGESPISIDELLERAQRGLDRVRPEDLQAEMDSGALVVDVRTRERQEREGELPGAMVIERSVLEWRLAPSSKWRTVEVGPSQKVIIVCSDGYSSSLAAATLQELGLEKATDMIGGYVAWSKL